MATERRNCPLKTGWHRIPGRIGSYSLWKFLPFWGCVASVDKFTDGTLGYSWSAYIRNSDKLRSILKVHHGTAPDLRKAKRSAEKALQGTQ